ncbi:glycosyltransferase [Clostridium perfringens]|uniref:glycosyltransferase n=1 Tax=Clostridium perfringens TaxID=1502 RepID=UPI0018E4BDBF|nr:glycosyltransferase [Clostridium perfringens]MBI6026998.1 glycosyltransferase [Clostridium perfringens]
MKKCLHILPMNKLSGAEKMALLICKNMKKFTPVVVCGGKSLSEIFKKEGIESYDTTFSNKNIFKTLRFLKNIIEKNNIKIIHAHDNNASLNAYLVKRTFRLDIKVISHIHNCYPFLKGKNFNKLLDSYFRPRYDYNISCGSLVYEFYKKNTKYFRTDKTEVLSNAMDIKEINKFDFNKSKKIIEKFNIPKDKKILGFIGRLDEQKGIIPFIKELSKYKEYFNDCTFLLVGSGSQEQEIKILIKELNLDKYFILTGFQEDTYKFYPIIDVFFLPSLYEGLPMVLLEAMAFKKTIVSMDVGSIGELINDKTGVLIKKGDYKAFINYLKYIKDNENKVKRYGEEASRFVRENYNIESYVEKVEKKYKSLIS